MIILTANPYKRSVRIINVEGDPGSGFGAQNDPSSEMNLIIDPHGTFGEKNKEQGLLWVHVGT
jgi:hypothetical protein